MLIHDEITKWFDRSSQGLEEDSVEQIRREAFALLLANRAAALMTESDVALANTQYHRHA